MRRPAVLFSAAFGTGTVMTYMLGISVYVLLVAVTGMAAYAVWMHLYSTHELLKKVCAVICAVLLGGLWMGAAALQQDPIADKAGEYVSVTGIITEADFEEDSCSLVIKRQSAKSIVKYYGDFEQLENCIGKSVSVYGKAELPQEQRNPGCFDYRLYLRSCGIQTVIKAESITIIAGREVPYLRWTGAVRNTFSEKMEQYVDDSRQGLIMAILFGDKTMLDEELYSDFQKNGTAHILAVSGLHTGIIYAFFVFLWRGKKGGVFYVTVTALLMFYMSLADFSPSVVRAACMIFMHLMAGLLRCRYDLLTSASLTFLAMLIYNPYQLFNVGFQMSFLAVVSLAVIIPFVKRYYQGVFLSAIAIQAGMVPYTAFTFNYISLGSVLANIPVIFVAGIMLPAGVCALISMALPGELFGFLIKMVDICCGLLIHINDFFYVSGKTSFDVISPPVWLLIVYYGVLFFFLSETGQLMVVRKECRKIIIAVTAVIAAAAISVPMTASQFDRAGIVFVDVEQGDCIHIKTDSGKNYLIDGGGDADYDVGLKVLKPYLLKNGVSKIDAAFVTHLHEDHYGGIRSLAADGMVEMIGLYEGNKVTEEQFREETSAVPFYLHRGYKVELDEGVYIEVISPEPQTDEAYTEMAESEDDENKSSLIMKVSYKGTTVLVTGDIDEDGEAELVREYGSELSCDIMKVPHHGSKYSSSDVFVDAADPVLAVFQVGRNNYGHPSEAAIGRYRASGCEIARNDTDGAIGLIVDDDKTFKVINMCN